MTYTRPPFSGLGRVISVGSGFQDEKSLQWFLWRHWEPLIQLPPNGFLEHLELTDFECWLRRPGQQEVRADYLAYDRRLCAYVVVELKRGLLSPPAVKQVAGYIEPMAKHLKHATYGLLVGSAISREALDVFHAIEAPMRIALIMDRPGGMLVFDPAVLDPGKDVGEMALGYLRTATGHDFVPDGNPAMADFTAKREKAIWRMLETWEPER